MCAPPVEPPSNPPPPLVAARTLAAFKIAAGSRKIRGLYRSLWLNQALATPLAGQCHSMWVFGVGLAMAVCGGMQGAPSAHRQGEGPVLTWIVVGL